MSRSSNFVLANAAPNGKTAKVSVPRIASPRRTLLNDVREAARHGRPSFDGKGEGLAIHARSILGISSRGRFKLTDVFNLTRTTNFPAARAPR